MSDLTKAEFFGAQGAEHVYIATPAHTICSNFHISLVRSIPLLMRAGLTVTYAHLAHHCHVDDARNLLVADFLASTATDLLFWDADVAAAPGAALRLLKFDTDIVGGAYPLKDNSGKFPVRLTGFDDQAQPELLEAVMMPTGFLRIRRNVFETLLAFEFESMERIPVVKMDGTEAALFFGRDYLVAEGSTPHDTTFERIGGDANFCRRAREAGFKVWCDPSLMFTHQGPVNFTGRLSDEIKREREHRVFMEENTVEIADAAE